MKKYIITNTTNIEDKLDMESYLDQDGTYQKNLCVRAYMFGDIETLKLFHEQGYSLEGCEDEIPMDLDLDDSLQCLLYVYKHGYLLDEIEYILIETGNVLALDYLIKNTEIVLNKEDNELECFTLSAAIEGQLEMIKYLYANDHVILSSDLMFYAINGYGGDCKKCSMKDKCCSNHKMDFVKYLHKIDCPWNERAYYAAIDENRLDIIQYLHENNCPLSEKVIKFSIKKGIPETIKYLLENDCPINKKYLNKCKQMFKTELWFQKYLYIKHNEINKYTLHIRHKIQRIQKAWFVYSLNPKNKIGNLIMHDELHKLSTLL